MTNYLKKIFELRKDFSYEDKKLISDAYEFSKENHGDDKLEGTDHPYFYHPAYAGFLIAKWGGDAEEICAGVLHDVYEDCEVHLDTIRRLFGHRIAFLIDGMSWERKWVPEKKIYLKNLLDFHKKRMEYIKQDIGLAIVLFSDEMSKLSDLFPEEVKEQEELSEKKKEKLKKRWSHIMKINVPFYKELGFIRLAKKVEDTIKPITGEIDSSLREHLSKKEVADIKKRLKKYQLKELE